MKGETGSPGLKGEKGEPAGGYYDPRYGAVGPPGGRGPPVRSRRVKPLTCPLTQEPIR